MNLFSSNASVAFPSQLHWDAQAIADAVPLRLFELYVFDPSEAMPSANRGAAPRTQRTRYTPAAAPHAMFRVRG